MHAGRSGLVADERDAAHLYGHIWEDLPALGVEAGAQALREWLAICKETDIAGLVLHGGSDPDHHGGLMKVRRTLEAVLPEYERAGVILALENHYPYTYKDGHELFSEPWEFLELLQAVDSPALRVCYDTGHAHLNHNCAEFLTALAPYIAHIHLADNGGEHDDHLPYRRGTVPWNTHLRLWRELPIAATYCVEFPVREDQAPFRQCVQELWSLPCPG